MAQSDSDFEIRLVEKGSKKTTLRPSHKKEAFFYLARLVPYFVLGGLYFSGQAWGRGHSGNLP